MIAVIDYDTGNLRSVENALRRLGGEYVVTGDEQVIRSAQHVLLPGVGEASTAMAKLRERGLPEVIRSLSQPVLGICIGMQLMCRHSEEGDTECMGIFDTEVALLRPRAGIKVPHMGWNSVEDPDSPLFRGIAPGAYLYYVHSYACGLCRHTAAVTEHGIRFSASLRRDNFTGVQFHPEKSGELGENILRNFLEL